MTQPQLLIPDQGGKLAIVTGATSGLGLQTATRLAQAGADVVLAVRNPEAGERVAAQIRETALGAKVVVGRVDLSRLASVESFAHELLATGRPIDILINNAGLMAPPERLLSEDGIELQLATNHVGHHALTTRILPLLQAARARVVSLGSVVVWGGRIRFDDLNSANRYHPERAYAQSKLACVLFARELHRRSQEGGWGIHSTAAHPGGSLTNLVDAGGQLGSRRASLITTIVGRTRNLPLFWQDAQAGALPTLYAATAPIARSGEHYGPSRLFSGDPVHVRMPRPARNDVVAARLWTTTEAMIASARA